MACDLDSVEPQVSLTSSYRDIIKHQTVSRQHREHSVLSLILGFLSVSVILLPRATFCVVLFCVICVFCLLVVLVRLSVPVQVIDWKDSSPK